MKAPVEVSAKIVSETASEIRLAIIAQNYCDEGMRTGSTYRVVTPAKRMTN